MDVRACFEDLDLFLRSRFKTIRDRGRSKQVAFFVKLSKQKSARLHLLKVLCAECSKKTDSDENVLVFLWLAYFHL